jgi:hypothetical protein
MKIAFISSGMEPGQDGVGDYTRRMACECIRQGHPSIIIGLNDSKVSKTVIASQEMEGVSTSVLRLSSSAPWEERVAEARDWLNSFNPDWVSLQFVLFGFHPKGLCFGLGEKMVRINSRASWHIMFHELWVGLGEKSSVKYRLWGAMQRRIIKDLAKRLSPQVVHTQAAPYQMVLAREGIAAAILPLFSNIPFVKGDGWNEILEPLFVKMAGRTPKRDELYLAGVFGAVHPEWSAEQTIEILFPLVQRTQKKLVLIFFGKSGLTSESFKKLSALKNRAQVITLGEKAPVEISKVLQSLDLGLATSPRQMIQKSGSVAAMLEHGLRVLVTRDDWHLRWKNGHPNEKSSQIFSPEQFSLLKVLPTRDIQKSEKWNIESAVGQMLKNCSR